jgi:hypothetical protein
VVRKGSTSTIKVAPYLGEDRAILQVGDTFRLTGRYQLTPNVYIAWIVTYSRDITQSDQAPTFDQNTQLRDEGLVTIEIIATDNQRQL